MRALLSFRPSKRTVVLNVVFAVLQLVYLTCLLQSQRTGELGLLMIGVRFLVPSLVVMLLWMVSLVADTVHAKRMSEKRRALLTGPQSP